MSTGMKFTVRERVQMALSVPPLNRGDEVRINSARYRGNHILYAVECIKSGRKATVVEQALTAL